MIMVGKNEKQKKITYFQGDNDADLNPGTDCCCVL